MTQIVVAIIATNANIPLINRLSSVRSCRYVSFVMLLFVVLRYSIIASEQNTMPTIDATASINASAVWVIIYINECLLSQLLLRLTVKIVVIPSPTGVVKIQYLQMDYYKVLRYLSLTGIFVFPYNVVYDSVSSFHTCVYPPKKCGLAKIADTEKKPINKRRTLRFDQICVCRTNKKH